MIKKNLEKSSGFWLSVYAISTAFGVYFCMYAFRKPFSVATFMGLSFWGVDYKILLVLAQVLGYMLSKFIGIRFISGMPKQKRAFFLLALIGLAELSLLFFALVSPPYNIFFLFLNGIPLGMVWGIVFSYLEGRNTSEVLGAGLSGSFIVSSGAVKSVGKFVMDSWGLSEFWMPFVSGLLFVIPLLIFTYLLNELPPPTEQDIRARTQREPMNASGRREFFLAYWGGLALLVGFYMFLTAFRDFRDNFMAEIWQALGYEKSVYIFTTTEIPIAVIVLLVWGGMMLIKNNQKAFMIYHWMIMLSVLLVGLSTFLYQVALLNPVWWMILVGLGLYVAYVPFGCLLFDRMLAAFRYPGTAGFMIYMADAFGYLGSVGILLYKNFGQANLSWLDFFIYSAYFLCLIGLLMIGASALYFRPRLRAISRTI